MYIPKSFQQNDLSTLVTLIEDYPLATLVCYGNSGMEAIHIPMYFVERKNGNHVLRGHIAKANTLRTSVENRASALVIFQGPQTYISPGYYPTKKEHGKAVPTWNYVSVHIKGEIIFIDDSAWKLEMLNTLTDKLEADETQPWKVTDAPTDYIGKMLGAIVGIEIEISSMEGQWKLSQNQPAQNQVGVIAGLSVSTRAGAYETAELMKKGK